MIGFGLVWLAVLIVLQPRTSCAPRAKLPAALTQDE